MVTVVGGGMAGAECAHRCAEAGLDVTLIEMRGVEQTPAHQTDRFAELVCSNSFKSQDPDTPAGQLKSEMKQLGSLLIPLAEEHSVPGGSALAVDRNLFAAAVTDAIESHPRITIKRERFDPAMVEQTRAAGPLVFATGPLTSPDLGAWIAKATGSDHLYFYDAVSPTVDASTIDRSVVFAQSRYDKGEGDDYLNCPFDKDQYETFVTALVAADRVPLKDFEDPKYFEGCKPIEEIAAKGVDSLRFGNFKPVGLRDPRTDRRPWAVVQLRPENRAKTLYSLVACQNRLKWGPQLEVLRMIPGLERAEFVRMGVIHRNTYVDAPRVLTPWLEMKSEPGIYMAGQITGVEGYVESAAMGLYVASTLIRQVRGEQPLVPPRACAYGSLIDHISDDQTDREFAPMNINWGLFPDPEPFIKNKGERKIAKISAAREAANEWISQLAI